MISVCMASYNGSKYIREQVKSILEQLSVDDELIISDDHSTDNTIDILNEIGDSRVKVISNNLKVSRANTHSVGHYRVTRNFENSIRHAKGDYIVLADQDDVWLPKKIVQMISSLQSAQVVMSNYSVINGEGEVLLEKFYKKNPISRSFIVNLIKMPFHGCCMAFRREILEHILPFPDNLIMHDNWIGLYANWQGYKINYIKIPLIKYRRHQLNVSPSANKNKNPLWFKVFYRLQFLVCILKRK